MDYFKIYNQIINKAKSEERKKLKRNNKDYIYYESHHILPKCLNSYNQSEVLLTAREHFICHWLLVRLFPDHSPLLYAFWAMCNQKGEKQERYIPSSRVYEEAKECWIKNGNHKHSEETKRKISEGNKGKIRTEEVREKNRKGSLGKKHSEESKKKISEANKGRVISKEVREESSRSRKGKPSYVRTPEINKKISDSKKGVPKSEEEKKKMSESKKLLWSNEEYRKIRKSRTCCIYCKLEFCVTGITRHLNIKHNKII